MFEYEGSEYTLEEVTKAAEDKKLSVEDYVSKFNLKEIKTEQPVEKPSDVVVEDAAVTSEPEQASEILVLDSEDTSLDLPKIDNSEAAIKKRRKENAKQDAIINAAKPIELEEVVVTGVQSLERDALDYIGADVFAGGTPAERLRQHQKLQQYIQEKRGGEFDVPELGYYESTGPAATGFAPGMGIVTDEFDFNVDEDTFKRGKALGLFGKSEIERNYKNSDRTGVVFSYTGAKPKEDSNLRTIDIPKSRQIFIENITNQELSNQLKETDQNNLNFKVRAKGRLFVRDEEVEGEKLYDPFTGQVYSFDKAPDDVLKINEDAKQKAETTEVEELNNALTKQYYKVVALAKELNNYRESDPENFDKGASQFQQGGTLGNLFLGDTKYETGLNLIQEISNTGEIPEDITKLKSDHPFAEAFNTALTDYVTINKAYQLNLDPTKQKKTTGVPGFFKGAWQTLVSKTPFGDVNPSPSTRLEEVTAFVNVLEASGFQPVSEADISEALIASRGVTFGGAFTDISLWAAQVGGTRKLPGVSQTTSAMKSINNFLKQTKLASRSKIVRSAMDDVTKGFDEAFVFVASDYAAHSVGLKDAPSPEEIYATSLFAFPMGGAQSFATRLLNKFPAKTVFTPMLATINKPETLRGLQKNILGSSVGAVSYMFASAANDFDGFAYEYDRFGKMTLKSTTDFIGDFIGETAKISLLGAKSIFYKNGLRNAFINDIRAMQGHNPLNVSRAAKRTGYNENSIKKPDENTVQDITNSREASLNELGKSLQDGVIDQAGFIERAKKINEDYGVLESQAELNIAKEAIKAEDKSDLKPSDADIRTLVTKLQRAEKLTDRDNNTMVNTPLPIIFDRYGIKPGSEQAKAIENAWNNETVLNEYLNNSPVFKAPFGSKEREESYKFLQDSVILSNKIKQLKKKKDLTEQEKIELEFLEEQSKAYQQGGYKFEKLQNKLNNYYKNLKAADVAQAENILSATKEGERVAVESVEELQKIYDKAFPNEPRSVSEADGFYDPVSKKYYVNETKVKDIRNFTVDTHETGHFILRDALKNQRGEVTEDGIRIIDEVLAELTPKQRNVVQERIDANYRFDANGNERAKKDYYEEYLTTLSEAIRSKQIVFKENIGNSLENLVPFLRKKGVENLELNAETGKNLFELIKSYSKGERAGIEAAKEMSIAAEGVEVADQVAKLSLTAENSAKVNKIYEEQGIAGYEEILNLLKPTAISLAKRFENRPQYDKELVTDAILSGERGMLDVIMDYNKKVEAGEQVPPLSGFINNSFSTKTGFKRYIDAAEKVVGKEFTEDVSEAKGIAAEEVAEPTVTKEVRGPRKPTETTRYSNTIIANAKVENKNELENKITEATQDAFKGQEITRFGETRNIPESVAKVYGEAFGVNPQTFVDKKRNYQKYDSEGLTRIKQFLIDNAASDFARLPKTKDGFGKGTFIPNNVLNALYTNGKLSGTLKDYINLIKEKPVKPIYRDRVSQTNRALINLHIRNRMLENLIPVQGERLRAGAKFSETKKEVTPKLIEENAEITIGKDTKGKKVFRVGNKNLTRDEKLIQFGVGVTNPKETGKKYSTRDLNQKLPNEIAGFEGETVLEGIQRVLKEFLTDNPELYQSTISSTTAGTERGLLATKEVARKLIPQVDLKTEQIGKRFPYTKAGGFAQPKFVESTKEKDFVKTQEQQVDNLVDYFVAWESHFAKNPKDAWVLDAIVKDSQDNQNSILRFGAANLFMHVNKKGKIPLDVQLREEHSTPQNNIGTILEQAAIDGNVESIRPLMKAIYMQGGLTRVDDGLVNILYKSTMPEFFYKEIVPAILSGKVKLDPGIGAVIRMTESGVNMDNYKYFPANKTFSEYLFGSNGLPLKEQARLTRDYLSGKITLAESRKEGAGLAENYIKLEPGKAKAETKNNGELPPLLSFTEKQSNEKVLEELGTLDKALKVARDPKAPVKKIRIFDFDDTLARSNSKVIYEMPDGTTGKLNATQFAERAGELEAQGATFDFAEFSKVVDGKKGPVFKAIENIVAKRGAEDVFILTARPADAASPIKEFMDALGVNLPIENIVGLGDGKAQAKARWITGKAAEGYNDFFFVDDAYKNVKAVRNALEVFDVKSKTQQAKVMFSETVDLSKDFNDIIENKTGIGAEKVYSRAKAQVVGASKGSIFKGIPYSAQDFTGLLYETLGKGKLGDQQMAWYKYNLLDPFARGVNDISRDRVAMMNDYKSLKKELGVIPKDLRKKLPGEPYTKEQAVRVYTWNQLQGMEVPGVSKADLKTLNEFVNNSPELKVFAEQLVAINKGDGYAKPKETWLTGSITTDLLEGLNTTKRTKYLEQWQTNVDQIFSEANLNKLEAAYGKKYRKAIENSLQRMKTGRNRSFSDDGLTGRFTDWLNGSIGVTMFFNTRSALLQTLSSVNFVNFSDNNPLKAAKAFGNQKQYWKDFKYLMNSDFLKERRGGLRMNVNEADIADAANKNGPRGVVNKLLQFGFTPTQIADSFAIASGGSTFYRNRIKTYEKQGLSTAEAEAKAFEDFRETAEESQQSSRPDRISMQQAGPLGRPILAYGNTPAQYLRKTDKAIKDLKAGRGDAKTNISKIIYYTTVQNLIFNSLQQGLFAIAFGEADADDEKYTNKYIDVANGMADSILRGAGVGGSAVSVGKNAIIRIMREQEKKQPKLEKIGYELAKISPPVSSKLSKINQAARSYQWDKDEMLSKGFSIDNPAYLAGANVIAATTNVPLDRAIKKVNNVIAATEADAELWERLALMGGWPEWSIEEPESKKLSSKSQPKEIKRRKIKKKVIK